MPNSIEVFTNCYHRFGLIAALEGISRLGITKIEIGIDTFPGILDLPRTLAGLDQWDFGQVQRLKGLLSRYGLSAESGFIFVENVDKELFEIDKVKFDVANALDLKVVDLSVTWNKPLKEAYKVFPSVLEYCSQFSFELALELHPPLFDNADVFWKVAKDFPDFPLRANFDTANLYYYNEGLDGPDELEKVLPCLAHMHLKDSLCKFHDFTFPALGEGTVPFDRYFQVLWKANWEGPCSLEVEGEDVEQSSYDGKHRVMERSVEFLRQKGFLA